MVIRVIYININSDSHSLNDFRFLPIDVVKNEMDRLCKETSIYLFYSIP